MTVTFTNFFYRDVKSEVNAKGTENCNNLGKLFYEKLENIDDRGWPENRDLVDPKADEEMRICSSYPSKHTTILHWAELGN